MTSLQDISRNDVKPSWVLRRRRVGQLDRAVTGEGLESGVERRQVLAVEGLGPVEVMGLDECHGKVAKTN